MKYSIQLAKEVGQIVPLSLVAHEIAKGFATRWGELIFHQPTYVNALRQTTINLIHAAQDGNLTVCDGHGRAIRQITDDLVTATVTHRDWPALREAHPECEIAPDFWDFSRVDIGPGEVVNEPSLYQLFAYLRDLNAWAEARGDSFTIEELPVQVIENDGMRAIVSAGSAAEIRPGEDSGADDSGGPADSGSVSSGAPDIADPKNHGNSGFDRNDTTGMVAWQADIIENKAEILREFGHAVSARNVMVWCRTKGSTDIFKRDQPKVRDSIQWTGGGGAVRTLQYKTVANQLSTWRRQGVFPKKK